MKRSVNLRAGAAGFFCSAVCIAWAVQAAPPAEMDSDGNGLPDIWEALYGGGFDLQPDADDDGDGVSNLDESRAGTYALDAASVLKLSVSNQPPAGIRIEWPQLPHRSSELESAESLNSTVWSFEGSGSVNSNDVLYAEFPPGPSNRFFRVKNTDLDLDTDGVPDWMEEKLGFSPTNSASVLASGDLAAFNQIYTDVPVTNSPTEAQAARFLMQATFGPTYADITNLQAVGIEPWIDEQMALPPYYTRPYIDEIDADLFAGFPNPDIQGYAYSISPYTFVFGNNFMTTWARGAIQADDQLRQRVAFALSQILVVSRADANFANKPGPIADYYDLFIEHAFGNYRDILHDVTFHACMGIYLSHLGNQKADVSTNRYPDENFAREIMQLFSIGLWELNPDGTRVLDEFGEPVPTYGNEEITELARVFTGLKWAGYAWDSEGIWDSKLYPPMAMFPDYHDFGEKTLLNGYVIPARVPSTANGLQDIEDALDHIFNHPNVGPFIGRQLIQFLVTSNPSREYVARISAVFDDNGSGVRGDLGAVVRAILLDPEARTPVEFLARVQFGQLREPVIRAMHLARVQHLGRFEHLKWWDWGQFAQDSLQEPMYAPSVFNFYRPDYRLPGPLAEGGFDSPAFGITDSYSAISFPNRLWNQMNNGFKNGSNYHYPPDWSAFLPLVMDVPALVDRAALLFCGGDMSADTRELIIGLVSRLDENSEQIERIRLAVYFALMSPEGATLK
ncbi:DUF1800 domain-containing protein [Pontiella agarivorans]|uniref:DUF1800 domain-containing protein n=1 Tax=Pontiella agarivorans TaxID=3038953 RepID=A0ABU5MYE1_9BACT|nr:DUF1800 domain-containing protein [Pontiella agarivorans]MDZ8119213.1 DUF1800 domain-containing protein [Pontiella agarivorans]